MTLSASLLVRSRRRVALLVSGAGVALLLAVVCGFAASATLTSFSTAVFPGPAAPPSREDGLVDAGAPLSISDVDHPAIAGLDPVLRDAVARAEEEAARDGIRFDITSGWRSSEYQRWLLEDAIATYGDEQIARELVATPELSRHVTGEAIDVGSLDAQLWIIEHGRRWGLCQTYANERWHFERATGDDGVCPEPKLDARG